MRLLLATLAILLLIPTFALGQSTAVTLQVTDTDGQAWLNGTWQVQLISASGSTQGPFNLIPNGPVVPNQLQSGGLTALGAATFTLTPNASIAPSGTTWYFAVCPNATTDCYRQTVVISGASQTVTLTPPAIRISAANAPPNTRAYADTEIVTPTVGSQYFNTSTLAQRIWLGTIWTNLGGGSTSPSLSLTNSPSCTTANSFVELDTTHTDAAGNATAVTASLSSKKVIGVAVSGAGCSGTVNIATSLATSVLADNQTAVGDWVSASATNGGQADDYGATKSANVQTVGIVSKANSGPGTATTIIIGTGDQLSNGSVNSNGTVSNSASSPCVAYYSAPGNIVVPDCAFTTNGSGVVGLNSLTVNGAGAGLVTVKQGTGISNPSAGNATYYVDSGTLKFTCILPSGASCAPATTSLPFSGITSGANTTANMQVSNAPASLSPISSGQVAGNQLWIPQALLAPSATSTTGGTINSAHGWLIQYTLNTLAGETTPSIVLSTTTNSLGCGTNNCTLTVVAPSLTGYTTYNVYACDTNGAICTAPQKVAACTAITTNCTFSAPYQTNTSTPPTLNTAWLQPPNIQATPSVESGSLFSAFYPSTDSNYHGWLTLDTQSCDPTSGPACPGGTPVFFGRTWFTNLTANPVDYPSFPFAFKNSAFVFNADISQSGLVTTNQSRAIGVMVQNPANDSASRYSMEGIQVEADIHGAPVWSGAPDAEVAAGSFQLSDSHTGGGTPFGGVWAVRAQAFRNAGAATYGSCTSTPCMGGVKAIFTNNSTATGSNAIAAALYVNASDSTNGDFLQGVGVFVQPPASNGRFGKSNYGIYENGWLNGLNGLSTTDRAFKFDYLNTNSPQVGVFQDIVFLGGGLFTSGCGTGNFCPSLASNLLNGTGTAGVAGATTSIPIWGSLQPNAGIATNQLVGATANTDFVCAVTGTTGTSYSYTIVAVDGTGFGTTAASSVCTVSAAATLNGSNYVTITMRNPVGSIYGTGAVRYDAYRTASSGTPSSTGFIGSLSCASVDVELQVWNSVSVCAIQDQGTVATGTVPTVNTTGGIATKGDYFFSRDKGQHFNTQAANNDLGGVATCAASTVTVTFTRAYTSTPVIVVSDETTAGGARVSAKSATAFTVTCTGATDTVDYIVVGNPN